ncbi:MAG TPA: hypothetical protein VF708_15465 [Pyrinomonadaceae bacterium]|jgi:hypothetical protein
MCNRNLQLRLSALLYIPLLLCSLSFRAHAQSNDAPLTSQEIVRLVYQLPKNPALREEIVKEIRRRGIGFPLTDGLLRVVATKSGNDALLRRTLEEAERRRVNPGAATLPSEAEARELLERTRTVTLAAAEAMPDFMVKELVTRSNALGKTQNWRVLDHLSFSVGYRANAGEEYKLLAVNGQPPGERSYTPEQIGGSISAGEFVTMLSKIFSEKSQTSFRAIDTDTLRNRRTVVYEYTVSKEFAPLSLLYRNRRVITGSRGRVWVDRETNRVLRLEEIAVEVQPDFPITEVSWLVDYDWVTIAERQYLLPVQSDVVATYNINDRVYQDRNEIRFRNYQKFGSEVKIIEDDFVEEETPEEQKKP